MINAIDFSKWNDFTDEEDLPKNTWFSTGEVILLKGEFKVGKSLFVQQLMTAVSTGYTWFKDNIGKIKTYGVFCEDDEAKLWHRQCEINELYELDMKSSDLINNIRLVPRRGEDNLLMIFNDKNIGQLTPYFEELLKDIQLFQPKLVVLDSVSDLFGGDEDNKFHLKQFIQNCCARIARTVNCAVLLCKHDNSEKAKEYNDKVWHLIKPGMTTDKHGFYGYGFHYLECDQGKIFYGAGDYFTEDFKSNT